MFAFFKKNTTNEDKLYNKILSFSRNKYFYMQAGLADTYQDRINLIFFHASFLIIKLKTKNNDLEIKKFSQKFFDLIFKRIEQNMRELGYGDVSVNKNMKILVKLFYNILLNCENYHNFNSKKKINLLNKYLTPSTNDKKLKFIELIKYFDKYETLCFDSSLNSVIKGDLNFKY